MFTIGYKGGFIHGYFDRELVRVQVDQYAYPIECKSMRAAKVLITKHVNKLK